MIGGGSALLVDIGAVDTIGAPNTVSPLSSAKTAVVCEGADGRGWAGGVAPGVTAGALDGAPGTVLGVTDDAKIAAASKMPPAPNITCFSMTPSNSPILRLSGLVF